MVVSVINIYKQITLGVILCLLSIMMVTCDSTQAEEKTLIVSIQPQKALLKEIVGDRYDVVCLLTSDNNPEAFEPSMSHLISFENSDAYFRIGNIGFELAILNKINSNTPNLKIYDTSEGITLLHGGHGHILGHEHECETDPHIWSSVPNMMIIAKNMYQAMLELDPKHSDDYTENYEKLRTRLEALNHELAEELKDCSGTAFAVWHPSLSYFAHDYGLKQVSIEREGKETSIKQLEDKIQEVNDSNVKVFFLQKEFDGRKLRSLTKQVSENVVTINPMRYKWEDEMRTIADAIKQQ